MKSILPAVAMLAALSVCGQGTVNFANIGVGLASPFTCVDGGGVRLNGGTWTVELWAGPAAGGAGAVLAGPAYMGAFANGYFNAGQRTVSNVTGGTAFAQVHVWDNMNGLITSFAQATATAGARWGTSGPAWFAINLSTPPATPATMVNMPAIGVYWCFVPEPSTIALGMMGASGILLLRGRK